MSLSAYIGNLNLPVKYTVEVVLSRFFLLDSIGNIVIEQFPIYSLLCFQNMAMHNTY